VSETPPVGTTRHQGLDAGREPPRYPATIDLHTHSLRSDGLLPPEVLVADAAAVGVRLLALADHDTLAGVRELRASGRVPPELELVPGVEINSVASGRVRSDDGELHMLGLGVDLDDEPFEAVLVRQRDARRLRFDLMRDRLRDLGMSIDEALEALPSTGDEDALGRPRLARALIAAGHAASVSDAFDRQLAPGRPAYVPRQGVGPVEAIRAIRAAHGLPVLAHFADAPRQQSLIRELMDAGLVGLEVYYAEYDRPTVEALADVASELGLLATGGTDYHGDLGSYAAAHATLWVPDEVGPPVRVALQVTDEPRIAARPT
jgi:3',5'-nucleoside bisphosphate phosphatase